jgi:hypothetical protein
MRICRRPLTSTDLDHELLWLLVSLGSFLALGAWLALHLPVPPCVFHAITHLPCPTCGATRAAWQFLQGHFASAFLFNPLASGVYCGIAIFDLYALSVLLTRSRRIRVANLLPNEKKLLRIGIVAVVACNWFYLLRANLV